MTLSVLIGVFFAPINAHAGFWSSIFSSEASASESNVSSQTNALDPNDISYFSRFEKNKAEDATKIVDDTLLFPTTGPMGVSDGKDTGGSTSDQVSIYVVRSGDSLSQIADMFDVSVNTILAANDMKKGDAIKPGQVLIILPISGIEHEVKKGETLKSIANKYKVDVRDITSYNGISESASLAVGDELLIPGGDDNMANEGKVSPNLGASLAKDKNYYANNPIKNAAGYFVNPLPTGKKTQGLHGPGHRGIDVGAPTGTPIYASASGTVLIAKTGWSGGYGNMVIIQHPNGTKTLYAHMSKLGTSTGASVSQGKIIGYVGSTGKSTGPHLHFEVFNAKNPGADWSWAK